AASPRGLAALESHAHPATEAAGQEGSGRPRQVPREPAGGAARRARHLHATGRVAAGRSRPARRGARAGRRAVRRGVGRGRHARGGARARPGAVGPGARRDRRDRRRAGEDRGWYVRHLRAVRPDDPEGPAARDPVRDAVRAVQEHGARAALSDVPPATPRRITIVVVAVAAIVVIADQLTNWWAVRTLADHDVGLVWTLRLHLVRNSGAAFSVGGGRGGLLAIVAIVVVLVLIAFGWPVGDRAGAVSLGLVLGGAVGNLADRVLRDGSGFLGGRVVDFVDLQWWPVFNVADASLVVGGLLLVLVSAKAPAGAR